MLPIIITPTHINAIVIGKGYATGKRLKMLEGAGVKNIKYFETPPSEAEFDGCNIAYIADFDYETSENLYNICKSKNIICNVEDKKHLCDFHVPSIVRRGDLLITSSTNGKSPRLSNRLRRMFEGLFDENWAKTLDEIAEDREIHRKNGLKFDDLSKKTDELIETKGFFNNFCQKCQDFSKK
jgi:precorrin-2 dehydrogenase/sirohydrochlorin ferrochelatase